ncbi:unnamed protein product [Ambrosiozyma monospora]|uniref:Unnamed protein product n=1 Tax=Ambrosiozyma monospora TaxID=43982 RepID=A0A9W6YZ76_AMBMO|nr:unnamed protein product [Ambrosiozyma monospora]
MQLFNFVSFLGLLSGVANCALTIRINKVDYVDVDKHIDLLANGKRYGELVFNSYSFEEALESLPPSVVSQFSSGDPYRVLLDLPDDGLIDFKYVVSLSKNVDESSAVQNFGVSFDIPDLDNWIKTHGNRVPKRKVYCEEGNLDCWAPQKYVVPPKKIVVAPQEYIVDTPDYDYVPVQVPQKYQKKYVVAPAAQEYKEYIVDAQDYVLPVPQKKVIVETKDYSPQTKTIIVDAKDYVVPQKKVVYAAPQEYYIESQEVPIKTVTRTLNEWGYFE